MFKFSANPSKITEIIEPRSGFRWGRKLIRALGAGKIKDITSIRKGANVSPEAITHIKNIPANHSSTNRLFVRILGTTGDRRSRVFKFTIFRHLLSRPKSLLS